MRKAWQEEVKFNVIKSSVLKRQEAKRLKDADAFWEYETTRNKGFHSLIMKDAYEYQVGCTLEDVKKFYQRISTDGPFTILILGDRNKINMKALATYAEVKELDVKYLFNYR
jgi:predicted transcriptional regulator